MTFNIGILTACNSDRHLSEPVYEKLKDLGMCPHFIPLTQNSIFTSYAKTYNCFKKLKYDFCLSVGDRKEQLGGVLAAFDEKIPIGHLYSGDLYTDVSDDIHRAAITLYSLIQFCSSESAVINTKEIMRHAGLLPNAHFVGATHFDGLNIKKIKENEYGLHTYKPYILILINSEMKGNDEKLIEETLLNLKPFFPDEHPYKFKFNIAKGNNDNEDIETKLFTEIMKKTDEGINIVRDNRQNHNFFLSLIANSYMFITNSSSVIYEAPALIDSDSIIHIGNRNKNRTPVPKEAHDGHASERVAKLIEEFLENRK